MDPLAGWTVAVTAERRAAEQVGLLQGRGATVLLAPTVRAERLRDDRLRDVTSRVRALLNGERVALSAAPSARALRLGQPSVPDLPIWLAATGERTIQTTVDLADGWNPIYLRRDRIGELAADIAKRRAATRPITVAAGPFTVVDPDVTAGRAATARALLRLLVTFTPAG